MPHKYFLAICLSSLAIGSATPATASLAIAEPSSSLRSSKDSSAPQILADGSLATLQKLIESVPQRDTDPSSNVFAPVHSPSVIETTEPEIEGEIVQAEETIQLRLSLSDRRVYVLQGDKEVISYPVAIGRTGWETPTGEFSIKAMVEDPGWTNPITNEVVGPGPNNPLGDRWMAFWTDGTNVIGFHGTPDRDSIGEAASHGCVRMYNEHARELFNIISIGTPVVVEP